MLSGTARVVDRVNGRIVIPSLRLMATMVSASALGPLAFTLLADTIGSNT